VSFDTRHAGTSGKDWQSLIDGASEWSPAPVAPDWLSNPLRMAAADAVAVAASSISTPSKVTAHAAASQMRFVDSFPSTPRPCSKQGAP
jgi:hypothetical protein